MTNTVLLLQAVARGEPGSFDRLFSQIYPELRRLAHARVRQGPGGATANTTGLVHDLYLRMRRVEGLSLADRQHFFAYASRVMRTVLVDMARERLADKRGGDLQFVTLNTEVGDSAALPQSELLDVDSALGELAAIDPRMAQVVEMRFFGGLGMREIAEALGTSARTVERTWESARSFLYARLRD